VFWWAKFRKKKGGVKAHVLYDVEAQVPKFFHITNASVHDSKVMKEIPIESGSYYIFDRAYNNFKELYCIHQAGGYFVVRAKKNLQYETVSWKRRLPKNVMSDSTVRLTIYKSSKDYPTTLRRVVYWDDEQKREFVFLSNATHITSLQVADLYKNRWQVELFFKWLKQHLKIKKFWGTTENAVRIQIYCAIIAYCLVAIVQKDMQLDRSTYEVLQILGISLTDKTHLRDLLDSTKSQNVKELFRPDGPNLFNF
jgi:IS4 transposase